MPTRCTSTELVNKNGHKVWREDGPTQGQCIWAMHGVWGWDKKKEEGVVLRETYFKKNPTTNQKVNLSLFYVGNAFIVDASDRLVHGLLLSLCEPLGGKSASRFIPGEDGLPRGHS